MPDEILSYMEEVTARALGEAGPVNPAPVRQPRPVEPFLETADRHKDAGTRLTGPGRMAFVKKAVLRVARLYTVEQATYNQAMLSTALELHAGLNQVRADVDRRLGTSQALQATTDQRLSEAVGAVRALEDQVRELTAALADAGDRRAADNAELAMLRSRVDMLLEEARRRLPEPFSQEQLEAMTRDVDQRLTPLYEQLEARFRGSRSAIVELQREYVPDVAAVAGPGAPVVDIGCGRGEWLELLAEHGIPAYGVDTNNVFVEANQQRGLDVRLGDAVEHLNQLDEASVGAVTSFHLVEHLPFEVLVSMIDAALHALKPGGVLIFETPNPENIVVGSSRFYIDPTHRNPVHPEFLEFLVTARGFVEAEIRYLHPDDATRFPEPISDDPALARIVEHLNKALFGPQDYAVVARKPA